MSALFERGRRWLREPLLHFLIVGAAIFAFYTWRGEEVDPVDRQIIVSEAQVDRLAKIWAQTWRRPPSVKELDGLIRDYIREEVYYREAIRLGLDQDDAIIRRRLRAKMEFLSSAEAETMVASDAVLQAWLDQYPARYAADPLISFESVYMKTGGDEAAALARAKAILAQLRSGTPSAQLGDPISLPQTLSGSATATIDRQFGEGFAASLARLPKGEWAGPVPSGFGLHLVRVGEVTTPRAPKLAEVRQQVENDWRIATRKSREDQAYQLLLDGYDIRIEMP
jgi:peptidyl-prolyl cis-trans isomerase C